MKYLVTIIFIISLSGCVSLQPVDNSFIKTYVFNPSIQNVPLSKKTAQVLLVMPVQTNAVYETHRMIYTLRPYQIAYFSKNRWADTPAVMLQSFLVQALQQTQHFTAVVIPPFTAQYDVILNTQLIKLQQNFWQTPSRVQLVINIQLINARTQKLIASKQFTMEKLAPSDNPQGGVIAANAAISEFLSQFTRFVVEKTI